MKINHKVVYGILGTLLAADVVVAFINESRFEKLHAAYIKQRKFSTGYKEMMLYYAAKLDEHRIPLTPFDRIAMNEIYDEMQS